MRGPATISAHLSLLCALLAGLLLAGCAADGTHEPAAPASMLELAQAERAFVIVMRDPRPLRARRGVQGSGYGAGPAYADDPALRRAAHRLARDHAFEIIEQWPLPSIEVHCLLARDLAAETIAAIEQDARVRWIQPLNEFRTRGASAGGVTPAPRWIDLLDRRLPERGEGIAVAVIDTAADANHPDLRRARLRHANFAGLRGRPEAEAHGTAVVGIIAATPLQPRGVQGLANAAEVSLLRACWQHEDGGGVCNTFTLALALEAAIEQRPDVLNLSLSGARDPVLEAQLAVLLRRGALVVAAFDEEASPGERFPPPHEGIVYAFGVTSRSGTPRITPDSAVVLHAPREALTLAPGNGYDIASGHSIATPQIAALAARLMDRHPQASRLEIVGMLEGWPRAAGE